MDVNCDQRFAVIATTSSGHEARELVAIFLHGLRWLLGNRHEVANQLVSDRKRLEVVKRFRVQQLPAETNKVTLCSWTIDSV